MGNCLKKQDATREINKQKYNKNVHKKFGWRGGILVERGEKGVEGHFQTAFTLDKIEDFTPVPGDKDEKYEKVNGNQIPKVLDLVANTAQRRNSV